MNDILKLGVRLFLFSLIAAAALAVTNEVTKGPIAEQKLAAKKAALSTVLPGCEYEQIEFENLAEGSELDEIFVGKDASGEIKGYALSASPQGYGGEIPITMGVSTEGHVTQVYVGALQETAGLGSRVGEDAFKEQFIGIAADPDTLRTDVDKISGASVSSGAFLNASEQILAYTKGTLGIEPKAGDKDAILAAAAAANGGAEAEGEAAEAAETEAAAAGATVYDVTGFQPFKVAIELDGEGKIVSVSVPEHNETPGLGADLIADEAVLGALIGQNIEDAKIDVKAGVTLTSNALAAALDQAAAVNGIDRKKAEDAQPEQTEEAEKAEEPEPAAEEAPAADEAPVEEAPAAEEAPAVVEAPAEGSAKTYEVTGFQPMKVEIALDGEGKIASVSVPEHNETPGLGADLIADAAIFEALVGQNIADAKIDVKAGVTLTSNAINDALAKAAAEAAPATEEAPAEGSTKTYEVTGFQPMKVEIALDGEGKIVSVSVPEHNETPGLGADLIADEAVLGALVGQSIADAKIDVKAGVTLTSNAINDALAQAAGEAK